MFIIIDPTVPQSHREFFLSTLLRSQARYGLVAQRKDLLRGVGEGEGVTGCVFLDNRPQTIQSIAELAMLRGVKVVALTTVDLLGIPPMPNLLVVRLHLLKARVDEVAQFLGITAVAQ